MRGFPRVAHAVAEGLGTPAGFALGVSIVLLWAVSGPFVHFSDAWQLVINTSTSIATFLMIFLLQYSQNRDSKVMQLKLDELIRALGEARTHLVKMENLSDEELQALQAEFQALSARRSKKQGG